MQLSLKFGVRDQKPGGELISLGQCKRNGLPGLRGKEPVCPLQGLRASRTWSMERSGVANASDLAPAGPFLSPAQGEAETVRLPWLSLSPDARAPGQAPAYNAGVFALVQPEPSHLGSAENDIWVTRPGTRWLGMGAGEDCEALTCVAASYVSWSGLRPIWTFFGHWRKHLRNLKSEQRGRERNGECAPRSREK